jgi:hypothetical protein
MSQTAYLTNQVIAKIPGVLADSGFHDAISRAAQIAMPFGRLGIFGTVPDKQVTSPTATGQVTTTSGVAGIVLASQDIENNPAALTNPVYPIGDAVPLLRKGRVLVLVEEIVTNASSVFIRFAAGAGGTVLGSFRASADTATAVAAPYCKYLSGAAAQGFAVVEINL